MSALICGSIAYDTIMVFEGRFREHIIPDKIHMLNVCFVAPSMRRDFGGCAGNIAYNLKLLGGQGIPMATVGHDFGPYHSWMEGNGIDLRFIHTISGEFTAQAFITTDLDDNQITAFHPGAMKHAHVQKVPTDAGVSLGILSPDSREGMLQHAAQFVAAGIPFIFDPGQGLPMFNGTELLQFIEQAQWVTVNDYEGQLLSERTGLSHAQIATHVQALIVTRGAAGSLIYTQGKVLEIPSATPTAVKDPTGCGDAYRAGLLYGMMAGMNWETTGRIAALMGAIKVATHGPQSHYFTMEEFSERYQNAFGRALGS